MAVFVVHHPLIHHKTTFMRSVEVSTKKFRELVSEITLLLTYEATRSLETTPHEVITPVSPYRGAILKTQNVVVAPILRAGLGMVNGMLDLFPLASVAHIGMSRDENTLQPRVYYHSMPKSIDGATVILLDPMLATAGSMSAAIQLVKKGRPSKIIGISLIAAPEGKDRIERDHPDVDLYVASLDEKLNEHGFIVPGLGDAGDRMFGSFKVELA